MEYVNVNKLTLRVVFLGFFIYICPMKNLRQTISKRKYDLLLIGCIILMFTVSVFFTVPAIIFLIIGESEKKF